MNKRTLCLLAWLWCAPLFAQDAQEAKPEIPEQTELPPDPASGPTVEALSDTELEALGLDAAGPRVDTSLHFWGFADFNSSQTFRPKGAVAVAQGRHQSFYVGNLNLYFSKNLSESFRTMAEVRLTYLPNGNFTVTPDGYLQTDTSAFDYANGQVVTRWGGIIMQRIYLEWTLHRFLSVRGGQYLSPFGVWNVDHGTPVIIPAQRPLALISNLYPERQTGLEFFGRWNVNNEQTLGYHLTLSNGNGPISEYKDLDRNKAVGGRLYWEYFGKTYVRSGVSGIYGRDTVSTPAATISTSTIDLKDEINAQADSLALAADLLVKRGGLHLQTEWMSLQKRYTTEGRKVHAVLGGPVAQAASADVFSWAGYVLGGYRTSWYGLMPFATFQAGNLSLANASLPDARLGLAGFTTGLNVSPIDSVVFKIEYAYIRVFRGPSIVKYTLNALLFQAAWSF
ncbi:MAG: hypothetical protein ABW352_21935 [Polyangiales bacterium]